MNQERIVRIVAGFFVMMSLALGVQASPLFVSPYFLFFYRFCRAEPVPERLHPLLPVEHHPVQGGRKKRLLTGRRHRQAPGGLTAGRLCISPRIKKCFGIGAYSM